MLDKIICELKDLGHKSNTFADKKHENLTKTILLNNGLKLKRLKYLVKKIRKKLKNNLEYKKSLEIKTIN